MPSSHKKMTTITFLGTLFIWLEYVSFVYLSPIIAVLFFPRHSIAVLLTLYLAQLIGAILFGIIGDYFGRKPVLSSTISLIAITSLAIGFLPGYTKAGPAVTLLLIGCHFIQGIAIAGEINGSSIFLLEHAGNRYPTLTSSWPATATGLGILLGYLYPHCLNHQLLLEWGWRIPFLFGGAVCLVLSYLRSRLKETVAFIQMCNQRKTTIPFRTLSRDYKTHFLYALLTSAFVVIYLHICSIYYEEYLIHHTGFSTYIAVSLITYESLGSLILMPLIALIADRIGAYHITLGGLIGCILIAPLLFMIAPMQSTFNSIFIESFFAFFTACACAPLIRMQIRLFPVEIRYTALSVAWCLSLTLFNKPIKWVIDALWQMTHWSFAPALLASLSAFITVLIVITIHRSIHYPVSSVTSIQSPTSTVMFNE